MGFGDKQIFNFSTANKIKDSVQDEIDSNEITKDSLNKLKNLKVDIFNNLSNLTIRNANGIFKGRLKEGTKVNFLGETKTLEYYKDPKTGKEYKNKLFLLVESNGKKMICISGLC